MAPQEGPGHRESLREHVHAEIQAMLPLSPDFLAANELEMLLRLLAVDQFLLPSTSRSIEDWHKSETVCTL